ncbi:MAG: PDZ domain-containing protein [Longimicrobiales bacterium]|nr:PDZ domain-containing protein [Longimicrobiales bacterium]
MFRRILAPALLLAGLAFLSPSAEAQTRLLRQPTLSATHVAFTYGSDLWIAERAGGVARRLTSTPAVEGDPHFSPDGSQIAFTSNRSGVPQVYVVGVEGGEPRRLSWYPSASEARGWTQDGTRVLYATSRQTAPVGFNRLWTVSRDGGPSTVLPAPWAHDGSYSPDGRRLVVDRVTRWDWEWRSYRGGQNTALTLLDLGSLDEVRIPNERTTDRYPVWLGGKIWFVSDRDWAMNVWTYDVASQALEQVTRFTDAEVKWLSGGPGGLAFEQDGWIHTLDPATGRSQRLDITVQGDFPWAEPRWEDVSQRIASASLSPTGKRALMEARGEIFTLPVEDGDARNLTRSSGAADRQPVWSPDGKQIAWFSDGGEGYQLVVAPQDGMGESRRVPIGESKFAWEATWSPDGSRVAFVDDDVRVRIVEVESGRISTADVGGVNLERGGMGLTWSPDSKWLAYAKTFPNNFRRIVVWSVASGEVTALTDAMADAQAPAWDSDGRHLYFVASTDLALGSGWANTSSIQSDVTYGAYVLVLRGDDPSPFPPESDEENAPAPPKPDTGAVQVRIDFGDVDRRILSLPLPVKNYQVTVAGPKGTVFIGEASEDGPGMTLHKFVLKDRKADVFVRDASSVSVSNDGEKMLFRSGQQWRVVGTAKPPEASGGDLKVALRMQLDRVEEWRQMFDEAWRYERDFFYDPGMHGNDWNAVRRRYRPLVEHVRHRADLNYVFDQVNGELSVGHSFVGGGDYPAVDTVRVGLLGADFTADGGWWRISRIYTFESWNPGLDAPLDRPGMRVSEGTYLVGVDGVELTAEQDPYQALDGTAGRQTVLHLNDRPTMEGAWTATVTPIRSESTLRQRAWVEDNRRKVDELSGGKLAYAWIPNTGGPGVVSFNRYIFAQQDKQGAVIDERFNGGGSLDDYMVDYMTRTLRAAITNEVPNGAPLVLPQGVLGPKVLLINERAGSGGDYFPWAFRQQKVGPLIGARTWGGLVKSSTHYAMVDGGTLTAPDNAVFDPLNNRWIAENEGVPPDIEVLLDARSAAEGRDPQLERAVQEALRLLEAQGGAPRVTPPPYSRPARRPGGR